MKKTLATGIVFTLVYGFVILAAVAQAEESAYINSRYGFSLTLPPGQLSLVEADNGDGITVAYPNGMTLKAYGTMVPVTFDRDCKAMYEEEKDRLDKVTYTRLNEKKRWFVVSGYREPTVVYIKMFVGKTSSYALEMSYPPENVKMFDAFVGTAVGSFTPGDME